MWRRIPAGIAVVALVAALIAGVLVAYESLVISPAADPADPEPARGSVAAARYDR